MTFSPFAFIFPGQGSQLVGMMAELNQKDTLVKKTFDEAADVLGYDLWQLVQSGPKETLDKTQITQPALLAASVAAWRYWCQNTDLKPSVLAGHSLGEYSALVASGALTYISAVELVAERAKQMQSAVKEGDGGMAAILGLDDEVVIAACEEVGRHLVVAANFNAPGQVVISGARLAVEKAIQVCKQKGAKRAILLPVSVPSHSPLMAPAAEVMSQKIAATEFCTPSIPLVQNVDANASEVISIIQKKLVMQLTEPVRWVASLNYMLTHFKIQSFIECGPGKVLHALNKRSVPSARSYPFYDAETFASIINASNL